MRQPYTPRTFFATQVVMELKRVALLAAVLLGSACTPDLPDDSDAACRTLLGLPSNGRIRDQCEPSAPGCILVACFGSEPHDVEPSCERTTLAYTYFGRTEYCRGDGVRMTSSCNPGWRRASFEPERAQCLTEAQRDEVFIMLWRDQPADEATP